MGECETRTQGASIAALWARLRTQDRAGQRGRAARASFRKELLYGYLIRPAEVLGHVEGLAGQSACLPAEDHGELAPAVEVVREDLDRRCIDVQFVPRRR